MKTEYNSDINKNNNNNFSSNIYNNNLLDILNKNCRIKKRNHFHAINLIAIIIIIIL